MALFSRSLPLVDLVKVVDQPSGVPMEPVDDVCELSGQVAANVAAVLLVLVGLLDGDGDVLAPP